MASFVEEVSQNPEANKAYHDWLELPWTKRVLDQVRGEGVVSEPNPMTVRSENALIEVGKNVGWHSCLYRICRLDANIPKNEKDIPPDFGAEKAMEQINVLLEKFHDKQKQKGTP